MEGEVTPVIKPKRRPVRLFMIYFLLPALLVYVGFLVVPILDSMRLSFYTGEGMNPDQFTGFGNFIKLFTEFPFKERFANALFNNIKFFIMVTLLQNVLGFVIAVLVTRNYRGLGFFRKLSFLPTTMSVLVVGFLFSMILNPRWGILDAMLRLVGLERFITPWLGNPATALPVLAIVISWQWLGETVIFYTAGIDAIEPSILEAAKIDGANIFQEVRHILIPSILPVIGIVTIMIFIGDFTQFDIVYAMTTSRGNPAYATDIFGSLFYRSAFQTAVRDGWGFGMGAAVSTVMFLIVFVGVVAWLVIFNRQKRKLY